MRNGDYTYFVPDALTAGANLGGTVTVTPTKKSYIVGRYLNFGTGLPAGPFPINGSTGVSNTIILRDFSTK